MADDWTMRAVMRAVLFNVDGHCALCETARLVDGSSYWLSVGPLGGEDVRIAICLDCAREAESVIRIGG